MFLACRLCVVRMCVICLYCVQLLSRRVPQFVRDEVDAVRADSAVRVACASLVAAMSTSRVTGTVGDINVVAADTRQLRTALEGAAPTRSWVGDAACQTLALLVETGETLCALRDCAVAGDWAGVSAVVETAASDELADIVSDEVSLIADEAQHRSLCDALQAALRTGLPVRL